MLTIATDSDSTFSARMRPLWAVVGALVLSAPLAAQSGGVAIGGEGRAHASAMLEVRSADRGLLIPRVALASRTAPIAAPATGLLVWNTATSGAYAQPGFYFWNGSDWKKLLLEGNESSVGSLMINGVAVRASAAEMNALVGIEGSVQSRLASAESGAATIRVDIAGIRTAVSNLQTQSTANATRGNANATAIAALQSTDVTLGQRITTNTDAIAAHQVELGSLLQRIQTAQADIDGFEDSLKGLTAAEIAQLSNLDEASVSSAQWLHLGSMDQGVATTDDVLFNTVTATHSFILESKSEDDFRTALFASTPTAQRFIAFPDADGTVALLSDLNTVDHNLQTQVDEHGTSLTSLHSGATLLQGRVSANETAITQLQGTTNQHHNSLVLQATAINALQGRTISAGSGLTGGGDLTVDRTLAIAQNGVNTAHLADDAVTDAKVVDALTIDGGQIDSTPIGLHHPSSVRGTALTATTSIQLPDESADVTPHVGMIRYNFAGGYLEFYHQLSDDVFAWVPVNSYAP